MLKINEEKLILEKIRLEYFCGERKSTFDVSFSPKLMKKYDLKEKIVGVDRRLSEEKSSRRLNVRRLRQMSLNLNRFEFSHRWTMFSCRFLLSFLGLEERKLSKILFEFSLGALDPRGELRFLLKILEKSSPILNEFPMNLPFELNFHYGKIRSKLDETTKTLLNECREMFPLEFSSFDRRSKVLTKKILFEIRFLSIDIHRIFVLDEKNRLKIYSHWFFELPQVSEIEFSPDEQFSSFAVFYPIFCFLSPEKNLTISSLDEKRNFRVPVRVDRVLSLFETNKIAFLTENRRRIEIFDFATKNFLSFFEFRAEIQKISLRGKIFQLEFSSRDEVQFLSIDENFRFENFSTKKLEKFSARKIFQNRNEFFFDEFSDVAALRLDQGKTVVDVKFLSGAKFVFFSDKFSFFVWKKGKILQIFQPIFEQNFFEPFFIETRTNFDIFNDEHSSPDFDRQSFFLAAINRTERMIDVLQWTFETENRRFTHRILLSFRPEFNVERFVFTVGKNRTNISLDKPFEKRLSTKS